MTYSFHGDYQAAARDHLWMHFTRHAGYEQGGRVPVMVRGEGHLVYDDQGKEYIDGLAGLFVTQVGHGRTEIAEAMARQASELAFFPLWSYAHPRAIELADRLAALTPGDLNRVFFTSGGGEAVPPSSSSRCRTPEAASRRRPAISSGSARSATITSGYAPMGAMFASDKLFEPFKKPGELFAHGYTFAGHPVAAAAAMANLDIFEREGLVDHVRENTHAFRAALERLKDLPVVGDVRGEGYFFGIELVKDKATKETFTADECERVLYGYVSKALLDAGLYCRADDRGDPVVQLSPPLTIGPKEFDEIESRLRSVLSEAPKHF